VAHDPGRGFRVRSVLDGYIEAHKPESDEHLLYPERTGAVRWEDRRKPLSDTAAHRWWHACLDRAGVKHLPMHSARHMAITDIVRVTGNLKAAKLFAGHASIQTTADIYAHFHLEDPAGGCGSWASAVLSGVWTDRTERNHSDRGNAVLRGKVEAAGIEPASTIARRARLQA
jgi:hypothetical protein